MHFAIFLLLGIVYESHTTKTHLSEYIVWNLRKWFSDFCLHFVMLLGKVYESSTTKTHVSDYMVWKRLLNWTSDCHTEMHELTVNCWWYGKIIGWYFWGVICRFWILDVYDMLEQHLFILLKSWCLVIAYSENMILYKTVYTNT